MRTFLCTFLAFGSISFGAQNNTFSHLKAQAATFYAIEAMLFLTLESANKAGWIELDENDPLPNALETASFIAAECLKIEDTEWRGILASLTYEPEFSDEVEVSSDASRIAWEYTSRNLFEGQNFWRIAYNSAKRIIDLYGKPDFPQVIFKMNDNAHEDLRFPYFEPFGEKILSTTTPLNLLRITSSATVSRVGGRRVHLQKPKSTPMVKVKDSKRGRKSKMGKNKDDHIIALEGLNEFASFLTF